ncbi:MAG: class I SAM-dependent methyltransferase [Acidobacteria bacterium]|nr:class I SAM-dependent methyltransferase [Acidobacteriota bacterium]MCB9397875.1 class I SAM-dependent methyltransferase [Acidobacteriota bacterium]
MTWNPQALGLVQDPCGFWSVPNPPDAQAFYREAFYQKEKPEYLLKAKREWSYWRRVYRSRLGQLGNPGRILDIGAGGGFFLKAAQELGWQPTGIEPSPLACQFAQEDLGLNLIQSDWADTQIDEPFDAIHCAFVLEHISNPRALIHRLFSWLRPAGRVWIEVPNEGNPLQAALLQAGQKPWWFVPNHHLHYFNPTSLTNLLKEQGFQILDQQASFPMEALALGGLNYLENPEHGPVAHVARMSFESHLYDAQPQLLTDLYRALAALGIGRSINLLGEKP